MSKQQVSIFMGGTGANTASDARTNLGVVARSGDTMTGNLNVAATLITQNVIPNANITYDLGSSEARFKDLWLSNSTIYLGEASISAQGGNVSFGNAEIQLSNVTTKLNVTNDLFVSGNVGIGTESPIAPLQVVGEGPGNIGTLNLRGANSHLGLANTSGTFRGWFGYFNTSNHGSEADLNIKTGYNGASNIRISADGDETDVQFYIQGSTGNIGIGTTSPTQKLHVNGTIRAGLAGNSSANFPALEVLSSGTGDGQAAIAIQQGTSEGDTIIFADYEPYVEWGISTENDSNSIQFTSGDNTNSLGSKTLYNRSGTARTAYTKFQVNLANGQALLGGNVGIGTSNPTAKLNIFGTGTGNSPTVAIDVTSSSAFVHSLECFAPNLTSSQAVINPIGVAGSTLNSAYIGYLYSGTLGSTNNKMTFGHWSADHLMTLDGVGRLNVVNQPGFLAHPNTSIDTTSGTIPFNATRFNTGSHYNTSTYTFTAPIAGKYTFGFSFWATPNNKAMCKLQINSSDWLGMPYPRVKSYDGDYVYGSASVIVNLSANDTVKIVWQEGTVHINAIYNYFYGYLIG